MKCERCGSENLASAITCTNCGASLLRGDRRVVTALLISISPPSELAAATALFTPRIERYGGTIARTDDQSLLAFFGAPITHEDDPQRAAYAALELLSVARQHAEEARRLGRVNLAVKVTLNGGEIIFGGDRQFMTVGTVVSAAEDLQMLARPMTALLSAETYRALHSAFECLDLGQLVVGKSEMAQVYELLRAKSGAVRTRRADSSLIGRTSELAALRQVSAAAQAGVGRVSLILGEPGLGKSRMISEWHMSQSLRWVEAQCQSFTQSFPYHLAMSLVHSILAIPPGASAEEAETVLREQGDRLFGASAPQIVPYLAHLLEINLGEATIQQPDPQMLAMQYADAFRRLLMAAAKLSPLVIVCEDIHWADPSSVELLTKALMLVPVTRILFCFTSRAERDAPGWRIVTTARELLGDALTEIQLKPLSDVDSGRLLASLLDTQTLPADILTTVQQKAEGNPFFVEELVRMLVENGTIQRVDERWTSAKDMASTAVPNSLAGLLLARIDRLPEDVKRVVRVASVIGRQFSVPLLKQVLGVEDDGELVTRLSALETASLIQLAQFEPELEYRFRHALLQDAGYASLLASDLIQLHLAVARAIEALYPERLDELAATLGDHYQRANAALDARQYFLLAAEDAKRKYANAEAIQHYSRALQTFDETDTARLAVLRARGSLHEVVGDFDAARRDHEMALAQAHAAGDERAEWQSLIDLGRLWQSRDYTQTGAYLKHAYSLAQSIEEPKLLGSTLNWLGNWYVNLEQMDEGIRFHEEALRLFEGEGDQTGILETVDLLSMAEALSGNNIASAQFNARARILAESQNDPIRLAFAIAAPTFFAAFGDMSVIAAPSSLDERITLMETTLEIVRSLGDRNWELFFGGMYGQMIARSGNYARGLALTEAALQIARDINHGQWQIQNLMSIGQAFTEICAYQRAQEYLEQAAELANQSGSLYWVRIVAAFVAQACIYEGNLERAETVLNAVIDPSVPPRSMAQRFAWASRIELALAREQYEDAIIDLDTLLQHQAGLDERGEQGTFYPSFQRGKALIGLLRSGRGVAAELAPQAEAALRAAEAITRDFEILTVLWRVQVALGELYRLLQRADDAEVMFASARAIVEQIAKTAPDEELRTTLLHGAAAEISHTRSDLSFRMVRGYQIRETLSSGGFGQVYRAYQPVVDREVAIKVILPQYANQPDFVRRFEAEAHVVAKLEHPHIVPLYDFWRDQDGAFLVMRFIRGGSLREAIGGGSLPFDAVMHLIDQIASALAAAHRQGVIHRDIKPDNILLDEDGNAYLTDFGIAKIANMKNATMDEEEVAGSLSYISPEQITGQSVSAQTDIYGLGVVLFEIIAGQHPFHQVHASELIFKHLQEPLPDISTVRADAPTAVNLVIQRATHKTPEERYTSATDLAQALRAALTGMQLPPKSATSESEPLFVRLIHDEEQTQIGITPPKRDKPDDDVTQIGGVPAQK